MNVIRSHLHDVYTEEVNKVALSPKDDKRVIMEDRIHTLALGYYELKNLRPVKGGGGARARVGLLNKYQLYKL